MAAANEAPVNLSDYQRSVANYWNTNTNDPVNLELGRVDDIYHHHYGLGEPDLSVLTGDPDTREERTIKELHRLETAQANVLLDCLGPIGPDDRIMDAGCGRGGTSIMANARFGCQVDGATISEYQAGFANGQAAARGVADRVAVGETSLILRDGRAVDLASEAGIGHDARTTPPATGVHDAVIGPDRTKAVQ